MKLISRVYDQYQIMPSLRLHQYRVAAVASLIIDHVSGPLERTEIISACLLHDMGNILKFDLTKFPEFLQPEGLEHWQTIQAEFAKKYGADEHQTTLAIAREIGVSSRTLDLIKDISEALMLQDPTQTDMAAKICEYCDLRVTPYGITSMASRWQDLRQRYAHRYITPEKVTRLNHFQQTSQLIEADIFTNCTLTPDQITEASAAETITELHDFVLA